MREGAARRGEVREELLERAPDRVLRIRHRHAALGRQVRGGGVGAAVEELDVLRNGHLFGGARPRCGGLGLGGPIGHKVQAHDVLHLL